MTDHSSRYSELLPMDKPLPLCLSGLGATAARARRRGNGRIKRALPWRRAKEGGEGALPALQRIPPAPPRPGTLARAPPLGLRKPGVAGGRRRAIARGGPPLPPTKKYNGLALSAARKAGPNQWHEEKENVTKKIHTEAFKH